VLPLTDHTTCQHPHLSTAHK